MTFRETFAQSVVCAPSRASLMTGLRPNSTRAWHLGNKFGKINPNTVTMPQYFSQFGYHTVNLEKIFNKHMPDSVSWDEPDLRPARYVKEDWLKRDGETFYISEEVNRSQVNKRDPLLALRPVRYADGWNTGPAWEAANTHDTMYYDGAQTELAKKTLLRLSKKEKPIYMGLGYFRPHLPFAVPKKYWDLHDADQIPLVPNPNVTENAPNHTINSMYELRHYDNFNKIGHPQSPYRMYEDTARILKHGYYASVSYVDAMLGNLIAHMKEIGVYKNTIIIVWGDHGWKLGDHNSWGKMTNCNIDLKVPMIIRHPNQENSGVQTHAITELVDMFPSLCELAGIRVPNYLQGTSFMPLINQPEQPWKCAAFSQFHRKPKVSANGNRYMRYSINTPKYHYIKWYGWDHKTGIRGDFKSSELYHRTNAPHEKVNIVNQENLNEVIADLSQQLSMG